MRATTKTVRLSDGRELVIREPSVKDDLERLGAYFTSLPPDVRNYLRYNVFDKDFLSMRLEQIDGEDHWRLIGEVDGTIVADGTMDREQFGWSQHVAELRAVVSPELESLGVRAILFNYFVSLAEESGIERLFTEVMKEQVELTDGLAKEGFSYEATRPKYAKDLKGKLHDLVILSNDVTTVWKRLAQRLEELDINMQHIMHGS